MKGTRRATAVFAAITVGISVLGAGCNDVPIDEEADATPPVVDSGLDSSADGAVAEVTPETSADVAETSSDDAADAPADVGCTLGSFCADGTICTAKGCTACASDDECIAIFPMRRCYAGQCKLGNCKPGATPTGCTATDAVCCETETTGGTCFSRAGETSCCDDSACAGLTKYTKCILPQRACGCPPPPAGELHVSPDGVDANPLRGNGSAACPFKTIAEAVNAASTATVATTIQLHVSGAGPTIYGTGCTGGTPCDSSPIYVPSTATRSITFQGKGATPAEVVVAGDGVSVFDVRSPGVGFTNLTIEPKRTGTSGAGGHGIFYGAPAGTTEAPEGAVTDVVIRGQYATSVVAGTGTAVVLNGAASPTLGPGLTIDGGFLGVNVIGPARPTIVGSAAKPVVITTIGDNCVRANSTTATVPGFDIKSSDGTKAVTIRDCGARAVSLDTTAVPTTPSKITNTVIRKTSAGGSFDGVVLRTAGLLDLENVDVINVNGRGLVVDAGSAASRPTLGIKNVVVTAPAGVGALFQGYGTVSVAGLSVATSASIGVQITGFAAVTGATLEAKDSAGVGLSISGSTTFTLDGVKIVSGASTGVNVLGSAVGTLKNVDVRDTLGVGVAVQGLAQTTIDTLLMRNAQSYGVRVLENAQLTLLRGDVRDSLLDGVRCEGTASLKMRRTTTLLNKANGTYILGACEADLGVTADAGLNVFNKTSLKNATSGLCFLGTGARPTPSSSTFGCGNTAAPCTTPGAVPVTYLSTATSCTANRDVTASGTMLTIAAPTCCFN